MTAPAADGSKTPATADGSDQQVGRLKLQARDADDLAVLSSMLQDAILPIGDVEYLAAQKQFVFAANRFRWETGAGASAERIHAGVAFHGVDRVQSAGIDRRQRDLLLNLLAITTEPMSGGVAIVIACAGGRTIRLEAQHIEATLEDFGEPWGAEERPAHDLDETTP